MKVAIIVGRFQVDDLSEGHQKMLRMAYEECERVIVFIGSRVVRSAADPLPYYMVANSVKGVQCASVEVYEQLDNPDNEVWIQSLMNQVGNLTEKDDELWFYGGHGEKDSFLDVMPLGINRRHVPYDGELSGTELRSRIGYHNTWVFRAGYIKAHLDAFPSCPSVVDAVITKGNQVLLGFKEKTGKYCVIGGFADDGDGSLEHSTSRETKEEGGLIIPPDAWKYLMSMQCDIFSYSRTIQPYTSVFHTEYKESYGEPQAGDDLDSIGWVDLDKALVLLEGSNHKKFIEKLLQNG